ncbi:MAG: helix-hairpin-helix domain-containing protein [Bacteroidales bacterium]|nr:helix-hairpin-helix domain-containing protein [Bacteroidales bacterium]
MEKEKKSGLSESFVIGVIALVFLIVGYQTALFIHNAAVVKIAANRDHPDTVYVYERVREGEVSAHTVRRSSAHSPRAQAVRKAVPVATVENFRFDPNEVSVEDLCRLGFTRKQAESIEKYRRSGGRFRRKEDFKRSYVVSDSIYRRLEKYIDIPLVDLNAADSADFDGLPGIGGWFASKMLEHRKALGGYSYKEQLMDIYRFDQEKFDGLSDLIVINPETVTPYPLWSLPADSLRMHPYIADYETARAIVLFRDNNPEELWTIEELRKAGVINESAAERLSRCILK